MRDIVSPNTPGDRSEQLYSAIQRLARQSISADVIGRIIRVHPAGIGEKYAERNDLNREIARVISKPNGETEPRPPGEEWRDSLIMTPTGQPTGCVANAIAALMLSPAWKGVLGLTSSNRRSSRRQSRRSPTLDPANGSVTTTSWLPIGYSAKASRSRP